MSSSNLLSISDLFFTSPFSNIWLLLLLPVLPDQTCQMSLMFSLGLTLFYDGISSSHVCIIVLRHLFCFSASAMAVAPRSFTKVCLTWGPWCRNSHQCRVTAPNKGQVGVDLYKQSTPHPIFCFFDKVGKGWGKCRLVAALCIRGEVESQGDRLNSPPLHEKHVAECRVKPRPPNCPAVP